MAWVRSDLGKTVKGLELVGRCPLFSKVYLVPSKSVGFILQGSLFTSEEETGGACRPGNVGHDSILKAPCYFPDQKEGHCQLICPSHLLQQKSCLLTAQPKKLPFTEIVAR